VGLGGFKRFVVFLSRLLAVVHVICWFFIYLFDVPYLFFCCLFVVVDAVGL